MDGSQELGNVAVLEKPQAIKITEKSQEPTRTQNEPREPKENKKTEIQEAQTMDQEATEDVRADIAVEAAGQQEEQALHEANRLAQSFEKGLKMIRETISDPIFLAGVVAGTLGIAEEIRSFPIGSEAAIIMGGGSIGVALGGEDKKSIIKNAIIGAGLGGYLAKQGISLKTVSELTHIPFLGGFIGLGDDFGGKIIKEVKKLIK